MAVMWPREIPLSIRKDRRRRAEVRVYGRLREVLDDSFTVFYSSPWLGTDHLGAEKDGECDFLITHAELGMLAIEVKGGGIDFNPATGAWTSTDAQKFEHNIKDPVHQARSGKHELLKKLKGSGRWRERKIRIAHGVIFPDAATPPANLGADRPRQLFCCSKEFAQGLRSWIGRRLHEGEPPGDLQPLGSDGVAAFTHVLAHAFHLHFTVGAAINDALEQFSVLEPAQFHVLDYLRDVERAEIRGGAGTGKTVIAAEEALRLAAEGQKTLLTCFNVPLARSLSRKLTGVPNLTVSGFHALCGTLAAKAGITVRGTGAALYNDALPGALMDAVKTLPDTRWDAVVVDEGQDFHANWWIALSSVMKDGARLRVFSDCNQRVYDAACVPVSDLDLVPIRLTRNLRNSRLIWKAANVHYEGFALTADGPEGPPVEWIETGSSAEVFEAAYLAARRLIFKEEVAPSDLAILLPASGALLRFREVAARSNFQFIDGDDFRDDAIVLDTVRRFKGLERPVVILVVGQGDMTATELAYVGMTRPRAHLVVVTSRADQDWLRTRDGRLEGM